MPSLDSDPSKACILLKKGDGGNWIEEICTSSSYGFICKYIPQGKDEFPWILDHA